MWKLLREIRVAALLTRNPRVRKRDCTLVLADKGGKNTARKPFAAHPDMDALQQLSF
jgi:hypothetical protein